jgi:hypothetical protein
MSYRRTTRVNPRGRPAPPRKTFGECPLPMGKAHWRHIGARHREHELLAKGGSSDDRGRSPGGRERRTAPSSSRAFAADSRVCRPPRSSRTRAWRHS